MMLVRGLGNLMTATAPQRCLSILIFHRVLERPDPLFPEEPDVDRFDRILRWLARSFAVLPLAHAVRALQEGHLPRRALAITFDDGYADNQSLAVPLLQRHGLHATFFVATGFIDGGRMWNDTVIEAIRRTRHPQMDLTAEAMGVHVLGSLAERRSAIDDLLPRIKYLPPAERDAMVRRLASLCESRLPDDLMMSTAQLQALHRAGMGIGGHTTTHPILTRISDEVAREEIRSNREYLQATLDTPITLFAYPNGKPDQDYAARHAVLVREAGYGAAVSTAPGVARYGADLLQLPRFTPWDRQGLRFGLRLVGNMRHGGRLAAA